MTDLHLPLLCGFGRFVGAGRPRPSKLEAPPEAARLQLSRPGASLLLTTIGVLLFFATTWVEAIRQHAMP